MWLSRLIVTAGLLLLSACSGFEIKSLGPALYEQNVVIAVVETGSRNGQLYSRQLRSRLQHGGASATHSVSTRLNVSSSSSLSVQGSTSVGILCTCGGYQDHLLGFHQGDTVIYLGIYIIHRETVPRTY